MWRRRRTLNNEIENHIKQCNMKTEMEEVVNLVKMNIETMKINSDLTKDILNVTKESLEVIKEHLILLKEDRINYQEIEKTNQLKEKTKVSILISVVVALTFIISVSIYSYFSNVNSYN